MKTLLYNYFQNLSYPVGRDMKAAIRNATRIAQTFNTIEEFRDKRINVWCRGSSGMILGSIFVANIPNNERVVLCHVKKPVEISHTQKTDCHKQSLFTQGEGPFINVAIDDFISSGSTIEEIQHVMVKESSRNMDVICLADCAAHSATDFHLFFKYVPEYYIHRENI